MNAHHHRSSYRTEDADIRSSRRTFWITVIAIPAAVTILLLFTGSDLRMLLFIIPIAWLVMLLNGFRCIIGVATMRDHLLIITYLKQYQIPWARVRIVTWYAVAGRIDVTIRNRLMWPFMASTWGKVGREIEKELLRHAHD